MNPTKPNKQKRVTVQKTDKPQLLLLITITTLLLAMATALIWGGITLYNAVFPITNNHAEEIAATLDRTLTSKGGAKKCSTGDDGHGSDNLRPWYNAYYELPLSKEQATAVVKKAAEENGYYLAQASAEHRSPILPADVYLNNWYFDDTSKQSTYSDLEDGPIQLGVGVNAHGSDKACKTPLTIDGSHTVVTVHVSLPDVKR